MNLLKTLYFILKAGRFWKNIPLLLTFFTAYFLSYDIKNVNLFYLFLTAFAILISSFFMTHINVITDYTLDKKRKPKLYNFLNYNIKTSRIFIIFEAILVIILIIFLCIKGYCLVASALSIFSTIALLYSYNFLFINVSLAKKYRLKVYWWGHFLVLIIGYMSLWYAGFFLNNSLNTKTLWLWSFCFFIFSLSEYSLFLLESSIDLKEETEYNIKSLSVILGFKKTNIVALLMNLFSIISTLVIVFYYQFQINILLIAIIPMMFVRLAFELFMLNKDDMYIRYKYLRTIPDVLFNFTRLYMLGAVLILKILL